MIDFVKIWQDLKERIGHDEPGTYVGLYASPGTQSYLKGMARSLCYAYGQDVNKITEDFHCTIVYSKTPVHIRPEEFKPYYTATATELIVLGEDRCLAFKLYAPDFVKLHKEFRSRGATHGFPEYVPHCTLVYGWQGLPPLTRKDLTIPLVFNTPKVRSLES